MDIYLYRSEADASVFAFTSAASGNNLPAEFSPWRRTAEGRAVPVDEDGRLMGFGASDRVLEAVQRDGFFLARGGVTIRRSDAQRSMH